MERILGQRRALDALQASLRSGRFHHAWIFAGPHGVGKFTTAVEIARILLDPNAGPTLSGEIEADAGGETSQLIDAGSHPDLHIIRKELALFSDDAELRKKKLTNIPIDLLRERMIGDADHEAAVYRTAQRNHGKVFIVDEAELLDTQGQDSLLKTLEEPPPRTYFFLITSRPDRLSPTIRSRCQRLVFSRLDAEAMHAWFRSRGVEMADEERRWVEWFADGSPGAAVMAMEYGFFAWQRALDPLINVLERGGYPLELGEVMGALADGFAEEWVKRHDNASKEAANKDATRYLITLLAGIARERLGEAIARGESGESWMRLIDQLVVTERLIDGNVSLKMALEDLAVQWGAAMPISR